jgi:glycosyltransferase involved in cell wall biosynthesis
MAAASLVLFFSHHSAQDALVEDMLPTDRARVVPIGVDHRLTVTEAPPSPPKDRGDLAESPYLLVVGARYRHKNRVFALRLLQALHARHAWRGRLVFAGAEVPFGSSSPDEAAWLAAHPDMAAYVVDVGAVNESEKTWLYRHADAAVYPTIYEGFGLIPFEAAHHGKPCLWAHQSALAEFLPEDAALLVPWDAERSADRAIEVLGSESRARMQVDAVRARAVDLTWDRTAERLVEVYREALAEPIREMAHLGDMTITAEASYWGLRDSIGPTGLSLVDPHAPLLPEEAQRTLAALARRPSTRRPLLSTLRVLGGLGRAARSDPPAERTWLDGTQPPEES